MPDGNGCVDKFEHYHKCAEKCERETAIYEAKQLEAQEESSRKLETQRKKEQQEAQEKFKEQIQAGIKKDKVDFCKKQFEGIVKSKYPSVYAKDIKEKDCLSILSEHYGKQKPPKIIRKGLKIFEKKFKK